MIGRDVAKGWKQLSANTCHTDRKGTVRITARLFFTAASARYHSQTGIFDIMMNASRCLPDYSALGCIWMVEILWITLVCPFFVANYYSAAD